MTHEINLWTLSDEVIDFLARRMQAPDGSFNPQELSAVASVVIARMAARHLHRGRTFEDVWRTLCAPETKSALKSAFDEERRDTPS